MTRTLTILTLALLAVPASAAAKQGADRNHDGLPDSWESRHHLSLNAKQGSRDPDHDGLSNRSEFKRGTNPRKADSDRDGLNDGAEAKTGNDPMSRDTDGDGVVDGRENAGMIASFSGGVLTLRLANGSTISGTVADAKMSCENEAEHEAENAGNHQRRRGATAKTARNGDPSTGSGSTSTASATDTGGGHNGGNENENEAENEQGAENESDNHASADCTASDLRSGTAVHEATLTGGVFTAIELVR